MTQHTPGPWAFQKAGNQWGVFPATARGKPRDGRSTEDVCHGSQFTDGWLANARLIAAAPDLLAALQAIVDQAPAEWNKGPWADARAAIAKATRGTP